jgi:hypothetical protein
MNWSRSRSIPKKEKDRTGPDFKTLHEAFTDV